MAKNSITDYSKTAASNTDIQSVDIAEGCLPSGINNAIREIMADLADMNDGTVTLTSPSFAAATITGNLTVDTNTLYVDSTNNRVGIGTSSLSNGVKTVIQGSQTGGAAATSGTTQTYGLLRLQGTTFTSALDMGTNGGNYAWIQSTDQANLGTNYSLAINPNGGSVGIGTSSPIYDLQIGTYGSDADSTLALASTTTGTGSIRFGDGTSGGEANAGKIVYDHSNNGMQFHTVAVERLRIDSSGNVGIGTSSPAANLHVSGSGARKIDITDTGGANTRISTANNNSYVGSTTNHPLLFITNDAERMRIDSSGNVGIGTTSPSATLDVVGSSQVRQQYTGASNGFQIGQFNSSGDASINNQANANLLLATNNTERMRIDSFGNVGIGTTSITNSTGFNRVSINDSSGAILEHKVNNTATGRIITSASAVSLDAITSVPLTFKTNASERMRIDSSGRLFVNTTGLSNYAQTSGDSSWMYRTEEGSVIQAQDADDGFSMMYMNKFDWTSSKDSRYINWYKNGSSVATIALTSGGLISYGTGSDYRLKENVTDMTGGINRIKQINPKQFNLIDDPDDTTMDGFLAHELATVIPEAVVGTHDQVKSRTNVVRNADGNFIEDGVTQDKWIQGKTDGDYPSDSTWVASWDEPIYQTVDYGKVTPLLVAALQEAITKIEDLEARVATLEGN